jgi:hypothetical protein
VEFRFNAVEWRAMTTAQRVQRCTILAEEAQKLAHEASDELKPFYLKLADRWLMLGMALQSSKPAST